MSFGGAWIDTSGATNFNKVAATTVIDNVNGTPASVTAALESISTGTLPGQVPGVSLIAAIGTAEAAVTAYGKTAATTNPTFDTGKDGSVSSDDATVALKAATDARAEDENGGSATTNTLIASSADKATVAATAKAAITAVTGGAAAISAYDAAFAADKAASAALDTASNSAATAASIAGLDTALKATDATVTFETLEDAAGVDAGDFASVSDVVSFLSNSTNNTLLRAGLVNELTKVTTYGTDIVKLGDLGLTADKADIALNAPSTGAAAKLAAIDATVDTDATTDDIQAPGYITKAAAAAAAADLLVKAQAADAKIATAKVVTDQYASLTKALDDAKKALGTFESTNTAKVDLHDVSTPNADQYATSAKADVFYFSAKANAITGAVADFGTGDSIVLGSGFTQGTSIAAGDSNVKEFFLVQGSAGVQVVLETNAFGNSTTTTDTNGNVTASPDAAVITLTGVTIADLTVSNGVISHVA